jgi:hypothetical protein
MNVHLNWKVHCQGPEGKSSNQTQYVVKKWKQHGNNCGQYHIDRAPHQPEMVDWQWLTKGELHIVFLVDKVTLGKLAGHPFLNKCI